MGKNFEIFSEAQKAFRKCTATNEGKNIYKLDNTPFWAAKAFLACWNMLKSSRGRRRKIQYPGIEHFDPAESLVTRIEQTLEEMAELEPSMGLACDRFVRRDACNMYQLLLNQLTLLKCEVDRRNNG